MTVATVKTNWFTFVNGKRRHLVRAADISMVEVYDTDSPSIVTIWLSNGQNLAVPGITPEEITALRKGLGAE